MDGARVANADCVWRAEGAWLTAMGRRKTERQAALFILTGDLPKSGGHPFYRQLNGLLKDAEFDRFVSAEIHPADHGDAQTLNDSVMTAQVYLELFDEVLQIEDVVADKGYHAAATLEHCDAVQLRTYIPEQASQHPARWAVNPLDYQRCVINNRRRVQRSKSKQLQRQRSERCERTFAHVCDTGGQRRSWLRDLVDVSKRYLIAVAGHNLGQILRTVCGIGDPRRLQDGARGLATCSTLVSTLPARVAALICLGSWPPTLRVTPAKVLPPDSVHRLMIYSGGYQTKEFHGLHVTA